MRQMKKKGTRKASSWNMLVMSVYREMKKKDKDVKFSAALKEASRRKKD
jgi:hypothetical protein